MLTIDRIKEVVTRLGKKYGVKNVYLFGSYAKNTATENSDVDLIIDKGDISSFREYYHLYKDLHDEFGTKIDLLTEKSVSTDFLKAIENDRILLYGA